MYSIFFGFLFLSLSFLNDTEAHAVTGSDSFTLPQISDLKEMFWFEIDIQRRFHYNMNQSRSYSEVKDAIMAEITAKVSGYTSMLSILDNVMMISVFYVFTKALRYRRGYLTRDRCVVSGRNGSVCVEGKDKSCVSCPTWVSWLPRLLEKLLV